MCAEVLVPLRGALAAAAAEAAAAGVLRMVADRLEGLVVGKAEGQPGTAAFSESGALVLQAQVSWMTSGFDQRI
jgi:hypothetical protein